MTLAIFQDFPGLENGLTKFHDFPGRVVTLNNNNISAISVHLAMIITFQLQSLVILPKVHNLTVNYAIRC